MITSMVLRCLSGGYFKVIIVTGSILVMAGCGQERLSEKAPIHLVQNMDNQPRYEIQGQNQFFADGMNDRQPIEGTIARGHLIRDIGYHTGRNDDSVWLEDSPVPVSYQLLKRGQERFDIYCAPCHGRIGDGQGAISKRGMLPPPTLHSDSLRNMSDGYLFEVMSNGKGNMPSYSYQVPVPDRWAIVQYIRALQRSQHATFGDLPVDTAQSAPESETE